MKTPRSVSSICRRSARKAADGLSPSSASLRPSRSQAALGGCSLHARRISAARCRTAAGSPSVSATSWSSTSVAARAALSCAAARVTASCGVPRNCRLEASDEPRQGQPVQQQGADHDDERDEQDHVASGKGAPELTVSGIAKAAASETTPRIPDHASTKPLAGSAQAPARGCARTSCGAGRPRDTPTPPAPESRWRVRPRTRPPPRSHCDRAVPVRRPAAAIRSGETRTTRGRRRRPSTPRCPVGGSRSRQWSTGRDTARRRRRRSPGAVDLLGGQVGHERPDDQAIPPPSPDPRAATDRGDDHSHREADQGSADGGAEERADSFQECHSGADRRGERDPVRGERGSRR